MGDEKAEFRFQEIKIDNVLLGLKVTSQLSAHFEMALRSLFRSCPAWSGQSTTIHKLVSFTNSRIEHQMIRDTRFPTMQSDQSLC